MPSSAPIAVSALKAADKIRAVIYANQQLAHAPLAEILKWAVETGGQAGSQDGGRKTAAAGIAAQAAAGQFIRLGGTLLIQYGLQQLGGHLAGAALVRFPLCFAAADYCPFICASAAGGVFTAAIQAESLRPSGFSVLIAPLANGGGGGFGAARGLYWLALGRAAKAA